ncbi:MAG: TolC family protein [Methylophilaceae bacterium]
MPEQPNYTGFVKQEHKQVSTWSQQDDAQAVTSLNQLINSVDLNQLLLEAKKANPSLQQTLITLKIRQAQAKQVRASQLPAVDAGFSGSKTKNTDTSYQGSITISWELDLWQKLANSTGAANLDTAQQLALYQSARDSLGADVMKSWLGLISQQQTIAIEQLRLGTLQKNEQFILQRYKNGLGSLEDLDSARTSLFSAKATIEFEKETLAQQQRALNTLLGRSQQLPLKIENTYPAVITPLADLPEQTLQRRPDLRAAYLAIEAEDLRTKVAYKEMLPSINLSATLKDVATTPSAALLNNPVWTLLAQLTAPLFRGGELKALAEVSELQTAYQYEVYRETLLNAIKEVENTLGLERSLAKRQQFITDALYRARNTLQQYQTSYRSGLVTILDLLIVQQQTYDLEVQLNNIIYTRLYNRVDLGLALGLPINTELKG